MEKKKFRQGAEADIALSRLSKTKRIIPFLTDMGGGGGILGSAVETSRDTQQGHHRHKTLMSGMKVFTCHFLLRIYLRCEQR
ncbi:hypothetical protein [Porphyromonas gingivalis]|uniref:hypothetical protein n=1 Tax=Porphyromonas gingivalis TaxID=837 RepID=UPI00130D82DF|nr:hypothetical protein [Porphyromonas gingivalis]